jgi:hypothetical protein
LHLFLQFLHISSNISRKRATASHKSEICPVRTLKEVRDSFVGASVCERLGIYSAGCSHKPKPHQPVPQIQTPVTVGSHLAKRF